MALGNRYKTAPGAGTLAALILVLVFGSPWYSDWALENTNEGTAGGWWLRLLAWPHWSFDTDDSLRDVIVGDLKAILVVVLTAVFLYLLPGSQLARARGTISQFFAGWAAYIFAGGFAALLATLFLSNPSLLDAFRAAGAGAGYGLFVGWIVGFASLGGRRGTR
ncbi:hypothetical protein AMIS_77820 [Actinoplanes missouriensis 431]|uniref:Uncharacterized protein n=1 Tax=Actinoplanes missouriensis (strain ATCC 14538 / DSM 43046 / CBS 188.64 / JCM 3121 / NBRC 102363 / NCIMB 12654 / NRRL B-3342 / UNCC 431) TaxID=512565 RepID=I0HJ15_ACTM4|nr:hypothetical protein [Actinoplanes missouriensis]BAL93002.1 hypothetical protein AMIS_77820 [Actinoplanes missouriensis 431]